MRKAAIVCVAAAVMMSGPALAAPDVPPAPRFGAVDLEILDHGQKPRVLLAFDAKPGGRESMVMELDIDQTQVLDDLIVQQVVLPTMVFEMIFEHDEEQAAGSISSSFGVVSTDLAMREGVPPGVIDAIRPGFAGMVGLRGRQVVLTNGRVVEAEIHDNPALPAEIAQSMDQMVDSMKNVQIPFPLEPVGVGAMWDVSSTIPLQAMTIEQVTSYTVTAIDGDRITFDITVMQDAAEGQKVNDVEGAWESTIKSYTGVGFGEAVFSLSQITPVRSTVTLDNHLEIEAVQGERKAVSLMSSLTEIRITGQVLPAEPD